MFSHKQLQAAAGLVALAALIGGEAHAADRSGVFCLNKRGLSASFVGRIEPDGSLKFGLSAWNEHGHLTLITGKAPPSGSHWQFSKQLDSKDERERCRLRIDFGRSHGVKITADPSASCVDDGGLGQITFAAKDYQGPVTVELNDPIDLVEEPPALLGKGACFKQNPG
jgi:hypothetical protein